MTAPARARQSLSARLLWLTVAIVLLTEVLIFVSSLGRARLTWLEARATEAHIAALSVAAAPDGAIDRGRTDELLRLSGTEMVRLLEAGQVILTLAPAAPLVAAASIDVGREDLLTGIRRAIDAMLRDDDRLILVSVASSLRQSTTVEILIHEAALTTSLRAYGRTIAGLSLVIAGSTGALVYVAALLLLVRPIRRITGSIAAFRADPERTAPLDPRRVSLLGDDEMALAGRELEAMQRELRAALWRNARLTALGTAVAKISHDLRGILSPALLAADRLEASADPGVRRAGDLVAQSVARATELVRRLLDFAREGPPPPALTRHPLAPVVDDAAETVASEAAEFAVQNRVAPSLTVEADRGQLLRVFANLLRNAAEAGAVTVRVRAAPASEGVLAIEIADDGPGLPAAVRAALFRPFNTGSQGEGTGLGLAIARDLMRAHGGDIELAASGPQGTSFRLLLPTTLDPPAAAAPAPG